MLNKTEVILKNRKQKKKMIGYNLTLSERMRGMASKYTRAQTKLGWFQIAYALVPFITLSECSAA